MAKFPIAVQDVVARELIITEKSANPVRKEPFYHYLPQGVDLPVIHVDISLLVYRMANWRTRTKQLDYVHREQLDHDYFQAREEDIAAQRVQHEILIEFANRGRGETIIPIMQKLKQDRRQMESLLVTSTGVVVNGNRRLAGMRELFADEPGNYPFNPVEVAVLPPGLTSQDLKKIEFQLQMQQETKLPYDWAIQCLSVRELAESGVGHEEIKHMMRLSRLEDVQVMITRLNEAEMYLADYLGTPENYAAIERQEQQFIELQKAMDKKQDGGEKELARKMCYVITKHSRELETRAYDFKIAFGNKTNEVAERLADRMNIDLPEQNAAPEPVPADANASGDGDGAADDDMFGDAADATSAAARFEPVRQLLADRDRSQQLAEAIADICVEIREENQDEEDAKRPLKMVKKARSALAAVEIDKAGDATIDDIKAELGQIIGMAEALLSQTEETVEEAQAGQS